jgi:predicted lipid-binding transport protein (Tim44 family)
VLELPGDEPTRREVLLELRYRHQRSQGHALHAMRHARLAGRQVLRQLRNRDLGMKRAARAGAMLITVLGGTGDALARAGGGGHGGGGHSSGSHSFHGGGSGGDGFLAVLVMVVLLYFWYRRSQRGGAGASTVPTAGPQAAVMSVLGAALGQSVATATGQATNGMGLQSLPGAAFAATLRPVVDRIRAQDPGFELEVFLQRAEMTFFLVKRGIQQNNAAAVRPFLSDEVFQQVASGIAASAAQHRHALLESLNVRAVHVQSAQCDDSGQRLQVHFDLVYRAKVLSDANQVLADEQADHRHGERWTFIRKAGAITPTNGGVIAARCPACGAELRLNLDGTCAHCRAGVTNGTVDWIVASVEQAPFVGYANDSSLAVAAPNVGQGIAALQAADPAFSPDAFRERVKTAFLALQDAWCKQNLDAGRAFLSPGAYFTWRTQLETLAAEGRRNVMEQSTVQRIEPILIVHGRVYDDITVRIAAAAADFEVDKDNRIVFGDRVVRPFTEDWTFQRSVGVATSQKPGTLENTCPNCGAPVSLTQIGECRYCKAAVTSGKFDWVVSRITQEEMFGADQGPLEGAGAQIALQVGGAIVGGLLSSLLSSNSSSQRNDWN